MVFLMDLLFDKPCKIVGESANIDINDYNRCCIILYCHCPGRTISITAVLSTVEIIVLAYAKYSPADYRYVFYVFFNGLPVLIGNL